MTVHTTFQRNQCSWILSSSLHLSRKFLSASVVDYTCCLNFPVFSPSQRSAEDLEVIYEELLHVKAAAHLSTSVSHYYCLFMTSLSVSLKPLFLYNSCPIVFLQFLFICYNSSLSIYWVSIQFPLILKLLWPKNHWSITMKQWKQALSMQFSLISCPVLLVGA